MNSTLTAFPALEQLKNLESSVSGENYQPPIGKINSHIHLAPNFSAFRSVGEAVEQAKSEGLLALGTSNYYDFTVYDEFEKKTLSEGIFPLFGIEIICRDEKLAESSIKVNDPGNPGKIYLCGKGICRFSDLTPRAKEILTEIRDGDARRMNDMCEKLTSFIQSLGISFEMTSELLVQRIATRSGVKEETVGLQERHLCEGVQELLAEKFNEDELKDIYTQLVGGIEEGDLKSPPALQNKIRSQLMKKGKPCFVDEAFVSLETAVELILQLGGIPCYPVLADGTSPVTDFEKTPEILTNRLKEINIHFAELIPIRNSPEVLEEYVMYMRQSGLFVSSGTEHNTNEKGPLPPYCKGSLEIPDKVDQVFTEGACLIAAHQAMTHKNEQGLVDCEGKLADSSRIEVLKKIGASLIKNT